ncbi:EF hand [Roseimaritima multifibrata]|uniref:EF hand n=1 Tax=Roseimaritima multifibrata TaxID=1930274 RepID=A0A517MMB1_9BACT|nr:hypothetical protein [Roseimaritima multifibrata]QDS96019.1 EF hand [Roseimaritima multifibrata]
MKIVFASIALFAFAAGFLSPSANAQPPGRAGQGQGQGFGRPGGERPGMGGPRGGQAGSQQSPPWLRIFDTNGDGELSASEIAQASSSLLKLDRNQDGQLTAEELHPGGGPGMQNGRSRGPGQGQAQRPGPGQRPGQDSGPGQGQRPGRGDSAQTDAAFAKDLLEFDENKDNLIGLDELPIHMHEAFEIADANKDRSLDQAERLVLAAQFRRNRLNPEGEAVERKNAPTQGRRPAGRN